MTCCHLEVADEQFGEKLARRDLRRFRKRGPDATTQRLIDQIRKVPMADATLLDIGSGIGVLARELLGGPVAEATLIDESASYQAVARELAAQRGTLNRCTFIHADFARFPSGTLTADLATLDRVICCYPDYESLLESVAATGAFLCGMSYPRDNWLVRTGVALANLLRRVRGTDFRVFVHPERALRETLAGHGFRVESESRTFVWKIVLFRRERG